MASNLWPAALCTLAASLVARIHRGQEAVVAYQAEEIRALREMLRGNRLRFTDAQRRRLALKSRPLSHANLREIGSIVTPGLAEENAGWGYTRIRDAMRHLGHEIGRTTVQRILDEDGIQPAPERRKHMPWATFLKAHWGAIAAMDFFKVEVLSLRGPIRYAVLVVMDLQSRRVQVAGIVREPYEDWMLQVLRNLIDSVDGFLLFHGYLIMDRDPVFTQKLRARLARAGMDPYAYLDAARI